MVCISFDNIYNYPGGAPMTNTIQQWLLENYESYVDFPIDDVLDTAQLRKAACEEFGYTGSAELVEFMKHQIYDFLHDQSSIRYKRP